MHAKSVHARVGIRHGRAAVFFVGETVHRVVNQRCTLALPASERASEHAWQAGSRCISVCIGRAMRDVHNSEFHGTSFLIDILAMMPRGYRECRATSPFSVAYLIGQPAAGLLRCIVLPVCSCVVLCLQIPRARHARLVADKWLASS